MAFVNETISEVDKEKLKAFNFKNPVTDVPFIATKWTVDRKRDIFFVTLGGQGSYNTEIPMFCALVLQNEVIALETYSDGIGSFESGFDISWKVTKILIPESLETKQDLIIVLIKEALDAYGSGYRRDHIKKVTYDFISKPLIVKGV